MFHNKNSISSSIDVKYIPFNDKDCESDDYGHYTNIEAAKESCSHDNSCQGINVPDCDDNGDRISLCVRGSIYQRSDFGTCVYNKTGYYIIYFSQFPEYYN